MTEAAQNQAGTPAPEAQDANTGNEQQGTGVDQKTVNKLVGSARTEARDAYVNDLLEKTGAESIDDLLSAHTEYKSLQEKNQTEADKAEQKRVKAEERAQAAEQRYTSTLQTYAVRDALRDAQVNPERLNAAMRLADLSGLEIDKDGKIDPDAITAVVTAVQEESPEWFGAQQRQVVNAPDTGGTGLKANTSDPDLQHGQWLASLLNGS